MTTAISIMVSAIIGIVSVEVARRRGGPRAALLVIAVLNTVGAAWGLWDPSRLGVVNAALAAWAWDDWWHTSPQRQPVLTVRFTEVRPS